MTISDHITERKPAKGYAPGSGADVLGIGRSAAPAAPTGFSAEEIEHLLELMADIVAASGGKHLAIFEMLEKELEAARGRQSALQRAMAIASRATN